MRFSTMQLINEHKENNRLPEMFKLIDEEFDNPDVEWNNYSSDFLVSVMPIDTFIIEKNLGVYKKLIAKHDAGYIGSAKVTLRITMMKMEISSIEHHTQND